MKFPFCRPSPVSQDETIPVSQHIALPHRYVVSQHLARRQWNIRLVLFLAGMLLIAVIIPASPIRQALGYGGGSAFINPICGHPPQVFTQLRPGATYTLPTKAQLMHLPTPTQRPISNTLSATYDPKRDQLCVASAAALDAHFGPAPSTIAPTITETSNSGGVNASFVGTILGGIMTSFLQCPRSAQ